MVRRLTLSAIIASAIIASALLSAFAGSAEAQMPVRFQARPLTLPQATLRPEATIVTTCCRRPIGDDRLVWNLYAGLGVGIIDDFELGALILPLELGPNADYLNPEVYVRYRFLRGNFEMGVEGRLHIPVDSRGGVTVGLPMLAHAGRVVRLDFGPYLYTSFEDFAFLFPFSIAIQVSNPFFFGFDTGVNFVVYNDPDAEDVNVPAGVFFGWTVRQRRGPLVDLLWGFRWLDVHEGPDDWQAYFSARFYAFL